MNPKISVDPKAVPASERKRTGRAKQFANMSEEQLKTFWESQTKRTGEINFEINPISQELTLFGKKIDILSWASGKKERERRRSSGEMSKDAILSEAGTTGFPGGETPLLLLKGLQDHRQANHFSLQKIIKVDLLTEAILQKFFRYIFSKL